MQQKQSQRYDLPWRGPDAARERSTGPSRPPIAVPAPTSLVLAALTLSAATAAVAAWLVITTVDGPVLADLPSGVVPVRLPAVISAAVGAALPAAGLLVLGRRTARPERTVLVVGAVGTVMSFVPPAVLATTSSDAVALCFLHVVVAATYVPVVARQARRRGCRARHLTNA